jgi:hypothetical protein
MLAAIWRICFFEWVLAFFGLGRMVAIGAHSIRGKSANSRRTLGEEGIPAAPMAVLRESGS